MNDSPVQWWSSTNPSSPHDARGVVAVCIGAVVTYCVAVLWYVATFPDVGLRCLLPESSSVGEGIEIRQMVGTGDRRTDPSPKPGDRLLKLNGREIVTFYDFTSALESLRFAKIPPGGQLAPGSDPSELPAVPPLVEVNQADPRKPAERLVELIYRSSSSGRNGNELLQRAYVSVRPISVFEISLTIIWFACQISVLGFAVTSYWYRPYDRVTRTFCLMCCAAMGAFVPGFHWWILTGTPLLNIPFIFCAGMLPALVLKFFLLFPREPDFVRSWRLWINSAVFGLSGLSCLILTACYWCGWALNGELARGPWTALQKLVAVAQIFLRGSATLDPASSSTLMLYLLRITVHGAIVLASAYFALTVAKLGSSLLKSDTPRERRQVVTILGAALLSTLPIGYTLYLAFFRKVDFALGRAQVPMFIASMLFMAAYTHGMVRHRLMLAEEVDDRGRRYVITSLLVSGGFAVLVAVGGIFANSYSLPLGSSTTQQITLFLILFLAAGMSLWVRDRLQAVVDRRFFSEKYQLDRAMQQLNRSASYLAEPSAMAEITLRTCQEVIDASWAGMFVRDGQGTLRLIGSRSLQQAPAQLKIESVHDDTADRIVIPRLPSPNRESMSPVQQLLHDHRAELLCRLEGDDGLAGVILLGRKRSGMAFTAEDFAFLQAIAQMSVLALHSSRANQTMARLNAELKTKMESIAEQQRQLAALRAELTVLQQDAGQQPVSPADQDFDREGVRGNSPALLDILGQVRKVARSVSTVLIRGESGTGKELMARVIHRNSDRANAALVCVNCAALSPSLLESELFGHVKGAFTGAHADKQGRFLAADHGTLFLDEIGDISQETQVKLLRVLQERCFEPVGSDKSISVDVRLVAATNRNLEEMIARGEFREDLFYRLNVVALTLPPLRQRPEDLAELVFFFLSRSAQKTKKQIRQIDPQALAVLESHQWPGNIRELENVIERAVVLADSDRVTMEDLPAEIRTLTPVRPLSRTNDSVEISASATALRQTVRKVMDTDGPVVLSGRQSDGEEQLLRDALKSSGGNKAIAARQMNMPRSTFFSKCKKYGIS